MSVTVVIPVRDGARFVGEAVESAAAQTLPPLEILVIDDGSVDASAEIARDAGATVVAQPATGPGAARNHGVRLAAGALVAFLDADDLMHPDRLRLQVELLDADPDAAGALGLVGQLPAGAGPLAAIDWRTPIMRRIPGLLPSALTVRADVFAASGGFATDLAAGEFVDWMARCRADGLRFPVIDEVVGLRRPHASNLTRDRDRAAGGYLDVARRAIERRHAT